MARGSGPYRGGARVDMGGGRRRFGDGGTTVHCRGLPYSATERDVAEFFQDYGVSLLRDCSVLFIVAQTSV